MKKVLVVDDEEINVEIMANIVSSKYDVLVAYDGYQAYDVYEKHHPDIIVTDILMPKLDGVGLAQKIRETDKDVKIIFLSSHYDLDYLLDSTSLDLTKYILKPIIKEELLHALKLAEES